MEITEVGKIALWILAILIPIQLIIGAVVSRKSGQDASHYFISGKQLPFILVFFTDFATVMGVGNFVGYAGKGYDIGLSQLWMMAGEQGSKIVFALCLAGIIGRYAYTTINEFLEKELFHDKWLRAIGGILMTLPMICWTGAQAIGIGFILSGIMGVDPTTGIWIAALTAILYTVMGGMWAIAWTDVVQGVIRVIVGFVFFGVVYAGVHGFGGIANAVAASAKPEMLEVNGIGFWAAVALFLTPVCGQFTDQAWWQRCYAAKDSKTARNGFLTTAVMAVIMCSASIMVGMAAYTLNPDLPKADMAFSWLMANYMNPWLSALLVVTIIGADMTVSAGRLNSGVTLLIMDVIKPLIAPHMADKKLVDMGRWLTLVLGIFAVAVALAFPSVLSAALFGYAVTGGGLFIPLILGLAWKDQNGKTYVTKNAVMWSLIIAGGTAAVIQYMPANATIFRGGIVPGVLISLVLTVGISLFERQSQKTTISG
ncbi:MAG: sodium:solute symporter family protein [Veillonellales bacterium]